jgi:general secretion pathway protein C
MKKEKKLYIVALFVVLTVLAYFLADTVDVVIGRSLEASTQMRATPVRNSTVKWSNHQLGYYSSVLERGLFGESGKPSSRTSAPVAANYKLIGTMEGKVFSGAVLEDDKGQAFYRINRKLPDGSVIINLTRNKVDLRRPDGTTVTVERVDDTKIVAMKKNNNSSNVRRLSGSKFVVDQKEVIASTQNMGKILTQARALPYVDHGKTVGFRISEIVPGSIFTKIGLKNGDVIQSVNSQSLDDPAKFFQLYQGLRNQRSISIDLLRGGQRETLTYEIK